MIRQDFHISELIARRLTGSITAEEEVDLQSWREESAQNEELFKRLSDSDNFIRYYKSAQMIDERKGWMALERQIRYSKRRNMVLKIGRIAAILLLPLVAAVLLTDMSSLFKSHAPEEIQHRDADIRPGEKKAVLTLNSGEAIHLHKATGKTMIEKDGTTINLDSATLNYQLAQTIPAKEEIYNRIDVPQGGEYSLTLSDGTKVYMNCMSSMVFPVQFVGDKRVVELNGEAYFEVAKSQKPFVVKINHIEVEVLGTTFNVSAYPDNDFQTTLVEGAVKIHAGSNTNCILKPSEQAYIKSGTDNLRKRVVDPSLYTGWVSGKIFFKDERLEDIMNTLSRWYDLSVFYSEPGIKELRFGCNVSRNREITPFLRLLEKTEKVRVEIKGKTITFKYKNTCTN